MLEGKVAIVTGASRGIGAAIAKKLGKLNATVVVNYQGSVDKANQVCEEIKANGGVAEAIQCDVSNFVISSIPTVPALTLLQNSSTLFPIGVIAPSPVTTTLLFSILTFLRLYR